MAVDSSPHDVLGQLDGSKTNYLTVANLPGHNHQAHPGWAVGDSASFKGYLSANAKLLKMQYATRSSDTTMNSVMMGLLC